MTTPQLPAPLPFSGDWTKWSEFIDRCYPVFKETLTRPPRPRFNNLMVQVDDYVGPDDEGKEKIFWHLTTKEHKDGGRDPDPDRAVRINWVRFLIDNHALYKTWKYLEVTRKGTVYRWYIWAETENFLVILQEGKRGYQLVTSFWVQEWNREKLSKKYEKRES